MPKVTTNFHLSYEVGRGERGRDRDDKVSRVSESEVSHSHFTATNY